MVTKNDPGKAKPKSKPEEIIVYPSAGPVKNAAMARGGNPHPSDPVTGGRKLKSGAKMSEPLLEAERIAKSPTKRKAAASSPRDGALADDMDGAGTSFGHKEGMAKSAQRKKPRIATETNPAGSRAKPKAQPPFSPTSPGTSAMVRPESHIPNAKMPGAKAGAEKRGGGIIGAGKAAGGLSTKSRGR